MTFNPIYNNREYVETDLRRYVNMASGMFAGKSEVEVYNLLSKAALSQVMLEMIHECVCLIACHSDKGIDV